MARSRSDVALLFVLVAILAGVIVLSAWMAEDAYITFRSVENLLAGYGPRWNVVERVQVFTHPLWFGVLALGATVADVSTVATSACVALSVGACAILLTPPEDWGRRLLVYGALLGSGAFVDYATSGLENALGYLLIVLFVFAAHRFDGRPRSWLGLALLSSLLLLTRLDLGPALVPTVVMACWEHRPRRSDLRWITLGAAPLVLWEIFSLVYYGSLIPNTALAKIEHGLPLASVVSHGADYLLDAVRYDPVTPLAIAAGIVCGARAKDWRARSLAVGLALQIAYVVWVGGDYMRGRFLAIPFVEALALLVVSTTLASRRVAALSLAVTVGLSAVTPSLRRDVKGIVNDRGIADERGFYYGYTGIMHDAGHGPSDHPWWRAGVQARDRHVPFVARCATGMFGYAAGPGIYLIDPHGLSEPFLARLPARTASRVGHYERAFPDGYLESRLGGKNALKDPLLAALYDDVVLASQGDLFTVARWRAIWRLTTGHYRAIARDAVFDREATGKGLVAVPDHSFFSCMGMIGEKAMVTWPPGP